MVLHREIFLRPPLPSRPSGWPLKASSWLSDPQTGILCHLAGLQTLWTMSQALRLAFHAIGLASVPSGWPLRPSGWPPRPSGWPLNPPSGPLDPLISLLYPLAGLQNHLGSLLVSLTGFIDSLAGILVPGLDDPLLKEGTKVKLRRDVCQVRLQVFCCRFFAGILQVVCRFLQVICSQESTE